MNQFTNKTKKRVRAGGRKGGKAAADKMTPEQRQERAKKAVAAREAKRKADNKR